VTEQGWKPSSGRGYDAPEAEGGHPVAPPESDPPRTPTQVVQLRIHGVGGATPEGLLGLPDRSETIRVAGDESAGFYFRPSDPHVEGYVWWKLTGGSMVQALWIVLFPFTFFNVANWMFPPDGETREWARASSRFLMLLLGLSLTTSYVMWEFTLVVQQAFLQWRLGGHLDRLPGWLLRVAPFARGHAPVFVTFLGILSVAVVGLVVLFVARRTRNDFEQFPGPEDPKRVPGEGPFDLLGAPLLRKERFTDRFFWWQPRNSSRLLRIHLVVGTILFLALAVWALRKAAVSTTATFHLRPWFLWLARVQVGLILALLLSYLMGWGWRSGFRWAPPVVVATVSVALTTGFFSGLTLWVANRVNRTGTLDFDESGAFGAGSIAFVLAALVWLAWHWRGRKREWPGVEADIPLNHRGPGEEPDGATPYMRRYIALLRSFSHGIGNADLVLSASALVFVLFAAPAVYSSLDISRRFLTFGSWVLGTVVAIALPSLLFRSIRPNANSKVKIVWDATTFWPRRFHPFAVRPYAERAVPELQGRLRHLILDRRCRVVVAAHSQGSILAYVALRHLVGWEARGGPNIVPEVALVTFGCPLRKMHARFFPAYFRVEDMVDLEAHLFQGDGADPCVGWTNFFRRTDYIGQEVFTEARRDGKSLEGCDRKLSDPPQEPRRDDTPLDRPFAVPADLPVPIFTQPVVHSYYNNSPELRHRVAVVGHHLRTFPPTPGG
jgi:hypothetical protein